MTVAPPPWGDAPAPPCSRPTCHRRQHPWGGGYCTDHAYSAGVFKPRAAPRRAREHLLALSGTPSAIARAAGLSEATVSGILSGRYEMISANTERRVLATRQEDIHPGRLPTWPLVRRIRALRAVGWTNGEVAQQCGGLSLETAARLIRGEIKYCNPATDAGIRRGYDEAPKRVRRRPHHQARAGGWVAPYQWEDIDWAEDPAARDRADEKPLVEHEFCQ